jgi:hypothetical protein
MCVHLTGVKDPLQMRRWQIYEAQQPSSRGASASSSPSSLKQWASWASRHTFAERTWRSSRQRALCRSRCTESSLPSVSSRHCAERKHAFAVSNSLSAKARIQIVVGVQFTLLKIKKSLSLKFLCKLWNTIVSEKICDQAMVTLNVTHTNSISFAWRR